MVRRSQPHGSSERHEDSATIADKTREFLQSRINCADCPLPFSPALGETDAPAPVRAKELARERTKLRDSKFYQRADFGTFPHLLPWGKATADKAILAPSGARRRSAQYSFRLHH